MVKRFGLADDNILGSVRKLYAIDKQWPLTMWDLDHADKDLKTMKQRIGDDGTAREHSGTAGYKTTLGSSPNNVSIFNPIIVGLIFKFYGPPPGSIIYDPFGGGGTRALMAASYGFHYHGIEIRQDEVDAVNARIEKYKTDTGDAAPGTAQIIHGDSRRVPDLPDDYADMLITCPPYYDMEKYDGGDADLSMAGSYGEFIDMLREVVAESKRMLRPGALSFWVIGLHRGTTGNLLPMHHDLAYLHHDEGFELVEEVILHMRNTGSVQRVGNFAKGEHRLVRVHEYLLIFRKPDDIPF